MMRTLLIVGTVLIGFLAPSYAGAQTVIPSPADVEQTTHCCEQSPQNSFPLHDQPALEVDSRLARGSARLFLRAELRSGKRGDDNRIAVGSGMVVGGAFLIVLGLGATSGAIIVVALASSPTVSTGAALGYSALGLGLFVGGLAGLIGGISMAISGNVLIAAGALARPRLREPDPMSRREAPALQLGVGFFPLPEGGAMGTLSLVF